MTPFGRHRAQSWGHRGLRGERLAQLLPIPVPSRPGGKESGDAGGASQDGWARGLGSSAPPPSVPAAIRLGGERGQAPCCSPTGHQAAPLAAWTQPVVLETLGGALGGSEPAHVGRHSPLTAWPLSRVARPLVFSRRCFRCSGVGRPGCDEAVPSVRQTWAPRFHPGGLAPGLRPDPCRLSGLCPGSRHLRGPSGARSTGRSPAGSVRGLPGRPAGARAPWVAPRSPGSCPSVPL